MCNIIGLQMPQLKLFHPRYLVALILGAIFLAMFVNGCYESFDDTYKLIHALMPAAIIVIFIARVLNLIIRDYQQFDPKCFKKTIELYEKHENDPKHRDVMVKRANETEFYTKLLVFFTFIFFHLPLVESFVLYAVFAEKFLFINNFLPWTDPSEHFGFILNLTMLTILIPLAFFALLVMDALFVFYGYQVVPLCDVFCSHLDDIGEGLMKLKEYKCGEKLSKLEQAIVEGNKQDQLKKLEAKFIQVIKEHRELDKFIKNIVFYTEIPNFFSITFNSLSIGLNIVIFFKINMLLGVVGCEFNSHPYFMIFFSFSLPIFSSSLHFSSGHAVPHRSRHCCTKKPHHRQAHRFSLLRDEQEEAKDIPAVRPSG
jgi:hypothetical protein